MGLENKFIFQETMEDRSLVKRGTDEGLDLLLEPHLLSYSLRCRFCSERRGGLRLLVSVNACVSLFVALLCLF
jgi:hypothetical protein